jgi:SAM-dependent methyltransferase
VSKADAEKFKATQRQIWGNVGDYPAIARVLEPVAEIAADLIPEPDGKKVLDIGAGTGNFSIAAAERGAEVTALELSPDLMEKGSARTGAAGYDVRWIEGDAEELPFGDDSFDGVGSIFGVIFAPRHAVATAEMCRVCKPGGRIVMTAWTPDGFMGSMHQLIDQLLESGGKGVDSPVRWGDPDYAAERFEVLAQVQTQVRSLGTRFDSVLEMRRFWELKAPAFAAARPLMKEKGVLDEFNQGAMKLIGEFNKSSLGNCEIDFEYLMILAQPR